MARTIAGLFLVLACAAIARDSAPVWAESSVLRIGLSALPASLDPAVALDGAMPLIARHVFDTLVRYREGGSEIEAGLAVSWAVSREGASWLFRLRPGVVLHDGTPLSAQHVAAALERLLSQHPSAPRPNAAATRLLRGSPGVIRRVQAPNAHTLQIDLVLPYAPLLTVLAHPALSIGVPVQGPDGSAHLLGSGPYRPVEVSTARIALEANPAHWAGPPRTERLEFLPGADAIRSLAELEGTLLDVAVPAVPPVQTAGARAVPSWHIGYLALQAEEEPFRRKKARQAVAAALVPARITAAVDPAAVPLQSFLPPGVAGRREGSPIMLGSPAMAQRLLAESGLRGRPGVTLLVGLEPGGSIDVSRLTQAVQSGLTAAGFAVQVASESRENAFVAARAGEHGVILMEAQVTGGDPHLLLYPLSSAEGARAPGTANLSFYRNPRLDDLLIRGSQLSFAPERLRVYTRAQALLADEVPWIPLYVRLHWVIARPSVRDIRLHPSGAHRFERAWADAPAR